MTDTTPRLERCLAHAVLKDPDGWLGMPSPTALSLFLAGAEMRAVFTQPTLPSWRIHGPLEEPDFYQPLVARTGHPSLTIKWATALEFAHFSVRDALEELLRLLEARFQSGHVSVDPVGKHFEPGEDEFWNAFAQRPAMFLGDVSGWHLAWYLMGMSKGGDWLALPEMARLTQVLDAIETTSAEAYGARFGLFRVSWAERLLQEALGRGT